MSNQPRLDPAPGARRGADQEQAMMTTPDPYEARRRRDEPTVTALVTRARNGDRQAWDALVGRYAPLI
jgi:hypothetical protein